MDPSYNNPFDSFGSGGQTSQPIMSPVGEDIVLSHNQPMKKKKTWFIFAVLGVAFVGIVIAVFAVIMMMNGGKNNGGESTQQAFNRYANYLLYGNDNNESVEAFIPSDTYYIDENYSSSEYVANLKELFSNFYNSIGDDERLKGISLLLSEEKINFLVDYSKFEFVDVESFRSVYENRGIEATKKTIYEIYGLTEDGPNSSENEIMYRFKQADAERVLLLLDSNYNSDIGSNASEVERYISRIVDSSISLLKRQCLNVYDVFKDKNEE